MYSNNLALPDKNARKDRLVSRSLAFAQLLNTQAPLPCSVEYLILICEFVQLIAQIIIFPCNGPVQPYVGASITNLVLSLTKIINFGYSSGVDQTSTAVFFITLYLCYILVLITLYTYTNIQLLYKKKLSQNTVFVMIFLLKIHARVSFYFLTNFALGWIQTEYSNLSRSWLESRIFASLLIILIVVSYIIGTLLWIIYPCILPSKSIFSSNGNRLDIMILSQKFIQGLLLATLSGHPTASRWILSAVSVSFTVVQAVIFWKQLPNYNVQALRVKGCLITVTLGLNLALLICNLCAFAYNGQFSFTLMFVLWTIFAVFFTRTFISILERKLLEILTRPVHKANPEEIIHKIVIYKQMRQRSISSAEVIIKQNLYSLYFKYLDSHVENFQPNSDNESSVKKSKVLRHAFFNSLHESSVKFPKSDVLKLFQAHFCAKKLQMYGYATKLTYELVNSSASYSIRLTALMLRSHIQDVLIDTLSPETRQLEITGFIQNCHLLDEIKTRMLKQKETQLKIYEEWNCNKFDIGKIQTLSVRVEQQRKAVNDSLKKLKEAPSYYTNGLLITAIYMLKLEFSPYDYEHYKNLYKNQVRQNISQLSDNNLKKENLDDSRTITFFLSADAKTLGQIVHCSPNVTALLGWNSQLCKGRQILSLVPQPLVEALHKQIKNVVTPNPGEALFRQQLIFMLNSSGHAVEFACHLSLYPFVTEGLFINMIVRMARTYTDYILISHQGFIEHTTERIAARLGIREGTGSKIHIASLHPQLGEVNEAANTLLKTELGTRSHDCNGELVRNLSKNVRDSSADDDLLTKRTTEKLNVLPTGNLLENTYEALLVRNEHHFLLNNTLAQNTSETFRGKIELRSLIKNAFDFNTQIETVMPLNKAELMYNLYISQGQLLRLQPLSQPDSKTLRSSTRLQIQDRCEYHCKIQSVSYQGSPSKLFVFKNIGFNNEESSYATLAEIKPSNAARAAEKADSLADDGSEGSSDLAEVDKSGNFNTEAERVVTTENNKPHEPANIQGNSDITFPMQQLISPKFNAITSPKSDTHLINPMRSRIMEQMPDKIDELSKIEQIKIKNAKSPVAADLDEFRSRSSASIHSENSDIRKLYKTVRNSLDAKHYSLYYYIAALGLLASIIIVLILESYLSFSLYDHVRTLSWNKEIVVNARAQKDLTIRVGRRIRALSGMTGGFLTETSIDQQIPGARAVLANFAFTEVLSLIKANDILLADSIYLADEERAGLFANNIRSYGSIASDTNDINDYTYMNTFQATNKIASQCLSVNNTTRNGNLTLVLPLYNIIVKNALNDIIVQSDKNIETVTDALTLNRAVFTTEVEGVSFVLLAVSVILIIALLVATRHIYTEEIDALSHLGKIPNKSIQNVVKQILSFENMLLEQSSFEEFNNLLDEETNAADANKHNKTRDKTLINKDKLQTRSINKSRVLYNYIRISAVLMLLFFGMLATITGRYTWIIKNLNSIYYRVDQLSYNREAMTVASLTLTTYTEIILTNGTTTILNTPSVDFYPIQMRRYTDLIDTISTRLENEDGSLDSYIQNIINEDSCSFLPANLIDSCYQLGAGSDAFSLLDLLTTARYVVQNALDSFLASPRTLQDAQKIRLLYLVPSTNLGNIIISVDATLASYLENKFNETTAALQEQNLLLTLVSLITLVILGVVTYALPLRRIRESNNIVKVLLKNFPVNIVLKNYSLKTYLINHCGGLLNAVKRKLQ